MCEKNTTVLEGCSPVPFSSYLKALGIFRIISKQKDPEIKGYWNENDNFVLVSAYSSNELTDFILNDYAPSPICDPWNGGSGFYMRENKETGARTIPTKNTQVVDAVCSSSASRLISLKNALLMTGTIVKGLGYSSAPPKKEKHAFISALRASLPDEALEWLDASVVLGATKAGYPALLGTGGNDGNLDFASNFFLRLQDVFTFDAGECSPSSRLWLESALAGKEIFGLIRDVAIGQFNPGMSGGMNASAGFKDKSVVNPWEYILMIEGTLVFASAAVRRFDTDDPITVSSPFAVRPNRAAYSGKSESESIRSEIWFPLWRTAAGFEEVSYLFSEGRATVKGRKAKDSLDIAMAVATMGVDRGISDFERYSFIERNGNNYFATPLGRYNVRNDPDVDILEDLHRWLKSIPRDPSTVPGSVRSAAGKLEEAMIQYCRTGSEMAFSRLFIQTGRCEKALVNSGLWHSSKGAYTKPVLLSDPRWLQKTYDGSVEYRLAASLAAIRIEQLGSIRKFCEPIAFKGRYPTFDSETRLYEKHGVSSVDTLTGLMRRILLTAGRKETQNYPVRSSVYASPEDIAVFISGNMSDRKLMDLFNSLVLLDWKSIYGEVPWAANNTSLVPGAWSVMKLVYSPGKLKEKAIPINHSIYRLAAAGDLNRAVDKASKRLLGSGYATVIDSAGGSAGVSRRMAAALLFPLSGRATEKLLRMVTVSDENNERK